MKTKKYLIMSLMMIFGLHINAQTLKKEIVNDSVVTEQTENRGKRGKGKVRGKKRKAMKQNMRAMRTVALADGVIFPAEREAMKSERKRLKAKAQKRKAKRGEKSPNIAK